VILESEGSAFYTLQREKKIAPRTFCIVAATTARASQRTKEVSLENAAQAT